MEVEKKPSLAREMLLFAVPLVLSGLLQQLYNIVDSLIIGNVVGEAALAAAGLSGPVLNVFIYVITGLVSGCTILVAHAWGAGDVKQTGRIAGTFALFLTGAAVLVSALGFATHGWLLELLHTPRELMGAAADYLGVVFLGIPFLAFYNLAGAVLRGVGNSKTPLAAIVLSSLVNVGLDLLLVWGLGWGIRGAAIATVAAQVLAAAYLLFYLLRGHGGFHFSLRWREVSGAVLREGLQLSLPRVIQSGVSSAGSLLLQNVMNSFGMEVVAAITTSYKIDSLAILPVINVSTAISVFAGQSVGAGLRERAQQCLRKGAQIAFCVAVCITALLLTGGRAMIGLFGVSEEVMDLGQRFFWFLGAFYPILALGESISGFLMGIKDVNYAAGVNILALVLRVGLSYGLSRWLGSDIIAISEICSWIFAFACFYLRYRGGGWKRRVVDEITGKNLHRQDAPQGA